VTISNAGLGGIGFDASPDIFVNPSANGGKGGSISLTTTHPNGPVVFAGSGLVANAQGGDSDGGSITINASRLEMTKTSKLNFSGRGGGTGSGGTVLISTTSSKASSLVVGGGNGQISADARGGLTFAGDGGNITIASSKALAVDGGSLEVVSDGD